MRYFAEISNNNIVLRVLVVDNNTNAEKLAKMFGGTWLETSMDGEIRKNYASVGLFYDQKLDAFIPPKPFDSWVLNKETAKWEAPIAYPEGTGNYFWDEENKNWTLLK